MMFCIWVVKAKSLFGLEKRASGIRLNTNKNQEMYSHEYHKHSRISGLANYWRISFNSFELNTIDTNDACVILHKSEHFKEILAQVLPYVANVV